MITIPCIAIDDEPPALRQMEEYISKVSYLELLVTFSDPIESIGFLKENRVDLIFLDIQMENLTGIEFLKVLKKKPCVILTTAYDTYALQAFDLDVDDYLLKPISFERFMKATEKIYDKLSLQIGFSDPDTETMKPEKDYFFVKTEFRIQRINFSDILYIEGMKEYLKIVLPDQRILTKQSFKEILTSLPEKEFARVHKSYVVSMNKIDSIRNNRINIGDSNIPVGNTYKQSFYNLLQE